MTRDEVVQRLTTERAKFDAKLSVIPRSALGEAPPGGRHSVKAIVGHVTAYEELIVERLRAARRGETTAFDRDRAGWEQFNARTWSEVEAADLDETLACAGSVFDDLVAELGMLTDEELNGAVGITALVDPAWLDGRPLWRMIEIDATEHYEMHLDALGPEPADAI